MEDRIRFNNEIIEWVQIDKNDSQQISELEQEWVAYMREIYADDSEVTECSDNEIKGWLTGRINIQGERDTMHFELIIVDGTIAGFTMYAVDLGGIKNIMEAGCGYIMEFYVKPSFRRKNIGTQTYMHIKSTFIRHGAKKIYLTPDSKSGIYFWEAMKFKDEGKIDPDNLMPIYVSEIERCLFVPERHK